MTDPRRTLMHAAVAAGGASAVLMSSAVTGGEDAELRTSAGLCLDPLLRAAAHVIDAAAGLPGEDQRAALGDVIADFLDLPAIGQPGRCRVCGCVEQLACSESRDGEWCGPCGWADADRTLCDNPDCMAAAAATSQQPDQRRREVT